MATRDGDGSEDGPADAAASGPALQNRAGRIELVREDIRKLGPLTINPPARAVRHDDGRSIMLEPRGMQVLVALLGADGAIVSRDELVASCWSGRIVGDDSISSVVYRLRRELRDLAAGVIEIETVTKVGFRVVRLDGPSMEGSPAAEPEAASVSSRPRRKWLYGALAAALLSLLAGTWWLVGSPSQPPQTVALGRIEAIGSGLPAGVAQAFDAELRAGFNESSVPLNAKAADLIVLGSVRRIDGARLRYTARVDDPASGATLWSGSSDRALAPSEADGQFAGETADTINCALNAMAHHGKRLRVKTSVLTFQACSELTGFEPGRQLLAGRRLSQEAPDFWLGWYVTAYAAGGREMLEGGARDPALAAEAVAAAKRVIALQPRDPEGYSQLALALPPDRPAEREQLLRKAVASRAEKCACALAMLGDFLLQAGRIEEARSFYQRAADQNRTIPLSVWRLAMADQLSGRTAQAEEGLRRLRRMTSKARQIGSPAAMWAGRWGEAADLLKTLFADEQAALTEATRALAAGDRASILLARAALEKLPARPESERLMVVMLSALGGTDAAMQRVEASQARGGFFSAPGRMPGLSRPLLFDPLLRPLWFHPRFPALLERAGFMTYWRQSRSRPDICRQEAQPNFCLQLNGA